MLQALCSHSCSALAQLRSERCGSVWAHAPCAGHTNIAADASRLAALSSMWVLELVMLQRIGTMAVRTLTIALRGMIMRLVSAPSVYGLRPTEAARGSVLRSGVSVAHPGGTGVVGCVVCVDQASCELQPCLASTRRASQHRARVLSAHASSCSCADSKSLVIQGSRAGGTAPSEATQRSL